MGVSTPTQPPDGLGHDITPHRPGPLPLVFRPGVGPRLPVRPGASGPRHKSCNTFGPTGMLRIALCSGFGGGSLRGRKPRPLPVVDADAPVLPAVARSRRLAWFQVQPA